PPTRRSILQSVTSPRFACHQRFTSSGVVHALNTRCFGASNSRVIRICVSVGRVTFAVPLPVTGISFLLSSEFLEDGVDLLEPLRPGAFVVLDPVVDGPERLAVHAVEAAAPGVANVDGADLSQHAQMLRDLRLGDPEQEHEIVHRTLAAGESVEDLPP